MRSLIIMKKIGLILVLVSVAVLPFWTVDAQDKKAKEAEKGVSGTAVTARPPDVEGIAGMAMLTTALLKWEPYGDDEAEFEAAGYKVYRRGEGESYGDPVAMIGPVANWTDYHLEKGKKYYYKVLAYDTWGVHSGLSDELPIETLKKPPFQAFVGDSNMVRVSTLDVLCVVYHGGMSRDEAERVRKGLELAREFLWRNSRCRLNLNMVYLLVDADAPSDGSHEMKGFEEDLRKRGYLDDQFDVVFATGPAIKERRSGLLIFNSTAGAMGWRETAPYPGNDPAVDYDIVWVFVYAFSESLDKVIIQKSGLPGFLAKTRISYSGIARAMKEFDGYDKFKMPWDRYIEVVDLDDDGIPDKDDRVPLDEYRLASNQRYRDTDNDYLDDIDEMTASIWWGSNNIKRDTDSDGIIDGKDPFPLVDFQPSIRKVRFVPTIDGTIEDTWKVLSRGSFWSSKEDLDVTIYAGWDDENLYFAVKCNSKLNMRATFRIEEGEDGERSCEASTAWGKSEVWGSYSQPPLEGALAAHWIGVDGDYEWEMKMPIDFMGKDSLEPGSTIGLSMSLRGSGDPDKVVYITEPHGFYHVKLEK